EVDRSVRYHRPLTIGIVRCTSDAIVDAIARSLRPMDLIAEDAGDDYLVILPELGRAEGASTLERLLDFARAAGVEARAGAALEPARALADQAQLRGAARDAARERAVRPRARRVHRRRAPQGRLLRGRRRRHAVPRRDRRDAALAAGQAAARPRAQGHHARRR